MSSMKQCAPVKEILFHRTDSLHPFTILMEKAIKGNFYEFSHTMRQTFHMNIIVLMQKSSHDMTKTVVSCGTS